MSAVSFFWDAVATLVVSRVLVVLRFVAASHAGLIARQLLLLINPSNAQGCAVREE